MNLATTVLFYLLVGVAVAAAVHLAADAGSPRERWFRTLTAIVFWPLYLPALLQRAASTSDGGCEEESVVPGRSGEETVHDEVSTAIHQVEAELSLALRSLDGWSHEVLAREQRRFDELRAAWHTQAQRIGELDELLSQPAFSVTCEPPAGVEVRLDKSEQGRRANVERLREVRRRLHDDLFHTLARVRELVTLIHLAKYTGAPASRTEELVAQIATCVESLSDVASWQEAAPVS